VPTTGKMLRRLRKVNVLDQLIAGVFVAAGPTYEYFGIAIAGFQLCFCVPCPTGATHGSDLSCRCICYRLEQSAVDGTHMSNSNPYPHE
jgi:hypothetical protein